MATTQRATRTANSSTTAVSSEADAPITVPGRTLSVGHQVAAQLQVRPRALNDLALAPKQGH